MGREDDDIMNIRENLAGTNRGPIARIWDKVIALSDLITDPGAGWGAKAIAIGALVYLVMPIDAVSDFIPVVGLLDDAGVIAAAAATLAAELGKEDDDA